MSIEDVTVSLDQQMLNHVRNQLGEFQKKAPNVINSALNRAITNVSANVSKEVRRDYHIKSIDIKETLTKTKSTKTTLSAIVKSKGQVIPLDRFKVSPNKVQPKRKKPIKIAVKKNGLKPALGAFVANIHGNKIFKRSTNKRLPIIRLYGPSVPQMLSNDEIRANINREGQETFTRRLDHEINRIITGGSS